MKYMSMASVNQNITPQSCGSETWEKQVSLSQGVRARRKALSIRHINGMEVRKKRPRGYKKRPRGFK
jgi:hypothetical protein